MSNNIIFIFAMAIITVGFVIGIIMIESDKPDSEEVADSRIGYAELKSDIANCHFVHNSCPFIKIDQKLDRIIELLEERD